MIDMEEEIISLGEIFESDGKTFCKVAVTLEALSQINGIIIGDIPDEDSDQAKLRKQVHKDCLRLFKEFKSDEVLNGR